MIASPSAPLPSKTLPQLLAQRLPHQFLHGLRPIIETSYDNAAHQASLGEPGLPYALNVRPHERNKLIFEHGHHLAENNGLDARALRLDNGYHLLEVRSNGLTIHFKHLNRHEKLQDQLVKADYRKQKAAANQIATQTIFEGFEPDGFNEPIQDLYLILIYADSPIKKNEVGDVFFAVPSSSGELLAAAHIEEVLNAITTPNFSPIEAEEEDFLDLPSQNNFSDDEQQIL